MAEPMRTWASAEAVEGWRRGAALRARTLALASERMLDAAGIRPGQRVLDLAAGSGEQSLLAARRIGPTGSLLATDISPEMLQAAATAAREAGLDNITTQVADGSALDLPPDSFDAAISRFGLMFMPDLHQALLRVRTALRPAANFAAVVWSAEPNNPYFGLQLGLLREMDRLPSPPPSLALTVSLGAPGVLEHAFSAAGFHNVHVAPVPTPREFPSADEALAAIRASSPSDLLQAMSDAERDHYASELARRLAAYVEPDGRCVLPGEALIGVGTK